MHNPTPSLNESDTFRPKIVGKMCIRDRFWLNQAFLDNRVQWKIGRLTVGEDFASFSCDFQNLTFCGSQPGNLVGSYWVNWPTSQWATRLKVNTSEPVSYTHLDVYKRQPPPPPLRRSRRAARR